MSPFLQSPVIQGEADYEAAIDQVIGQARSMLAIFDTDLRHGRFSSPGRAELIREFLLRHPGNRMTLVLHETAYLTEWCPRLINLLRRHSHAIQIRRTESHARHAADPFVIADGEHYVHRLHVNTARAVLALNDPAGAGALHSRFEQLFEASVPAVFGSPLGL